MVTRNLDRHKMKVLLNYTFTRLHDLAFNEFGKPVYVDYMDYVFEDIFGYKNFGQKLSLARNNKQLAAVVADFGVRDLMELCASPKLYGALYDLVRVIHDYKKAGKKMTELAKKHKKRPKSLTKEYDKKKKLYKDGIKEMKRLLGIFEKQTTTSQYGNLKSILDRDKSGFGVPGGFFDEDYEDDFGDDDDDDFIDKVYRANGGRASNSKRKKKDSDILAKLLGGLDSDDDDDDEDDEDGFDYPKNSFFGVDKKKLNQTKMLNQMNERIEDVASTVRDLCSIINPVVRENPGAFQNLGAAHKIERKAREVDGVSREEFLGAIKILAEHIDNVRNGVGRLVSHSIEDGDEFPEGEDDEDEYLVGLDDEDDEDEPRFNPRARAPRGSYPSDVDSFEELAELSNMSAEEQDAYFARKYQEKTARRQRAAAEQTLRKQQAFAKKRHMIVPEIPEHLMPFVLDGDPIYPPLNVLGKTLAPPPLGLMYDPYGELQPDFSVHKKIPDEIMNRPGNIRVGFEEDEQPQEMKKKAVRMIKPEDVSPAEALTDLNRQTTGPLQSTDEE